MTARTTTTVAETFLTKWPKLIRATTTDIGISFNFKFHSTNLSRKNLVHLHLPGGSIVGQWLIRNSNALISNKNTNEHSYSWEINNILKHFYLISDAKLTTCEFGADNECFRPTVDQLTAK